MVGGERPLASGDAFAGYRIESLAGRGGMGLVYKARDERVHRAVAVKVLAPHLARDDRFRARFEREARLLAELEHPNVIPIYAVGSDEDRPYIVMRFVGGTDLGHYLRDHGRFDPAGAARLTTQIAAALDAAHIHGLVHRDVKPANVLVSGSEPSEHLYLTDFGLTKRIDDAGPGLTGSGMFVGTLDYVAPEQISGDPVDPRADVYALGCLLYQLLTGVVPFPSERRDEKIRSHLSMDPPRCADAVPGLPRALDAVIERAMAKRPDGRFQSAGDLARAAVAAGAGVTDSVLARAEALTAETDAGEEAAAGKRRAARPRPARDRGGISLNAARGNISTGDVHSGDIIVGGDWHDG